MVGDEREPVGKSIVPERKPRTRVSSPKNLTINGVAYGTIYAGLVAILEDGNFKRCAVVLTPLFTALCSAVILAIQSTLTMRRERNKIRDDRREYVKAEQWAREQVNIAEAQCPQDETLIKETKDYLAEIVKKRRDFERAQVPSS